MSSRTSILGFGQAELSWPPLIEGILLRRYKRFMADIELPDGTLVTIHCPNSGSMKQCSEPGRPVYLSESTNLKRRLRYTWEMISMPTSLVCVNTQLTNRLVRQAVIAGRVPELTGYDAVHAEVDNGRGSRIDLVLEQTGGQRCFVEIKSVTLLEDSTAYFPDAVTARGLKHLKELRLEVKHGNSSVIFFLIQRMDAASFKPADHIDPAYGDELRKAFRSGVQVLCYDVHLDEKVIGLRRKVSIDL